MPVAKYVYKDETNSQHGKKNKKPYIGTFKHKNIRYNCGKFETIKESQIAVDIKRLSLGLKPNFLKPVKK